MSELSGYSNLAAQTLAEIAELDRRIASLVELRDGLKRVFARVSKAGPAETAHVLAERSRSAPLSSQVLYNSTAFPRHEIPADSSSDTTC